MYERRVCCVPRSLPVHTEERRLGFSSVELFLFLCGLVSDGHLLTCFLSFDAGDRTWLCACLAHTPALSYISRTLFTLIFKIESQLSYRTRLV